MSTEKNNEIVDCTYSVHAVIFGADESLLQVKLKDGFCFKRLSLNPRVSQLDNIFDTTDFGLRRDYETARLSSDSLDVICAVKETTYHQPLSLLNEQFENDTDKDLISLDNQIRAIRLLEECPLRFKRIAFHQNFQYQIDGQPQFGNHNAIVPIGEAMTVTPISKFHCDEMRGAYISEKATELSFPLSDTLLNSCHVYYDMSYHTKPCVSVTLLTTALEMLFLERREQSKQKVLAKRCSAFLYEGEPQHIQRSYNQLVALYDKRSDFVHEGNASSIFDTDIIVLRSFVRNSLLKVLSLQESKSQRISRLKAYVAGHVALFGK